jgi:hypothetical protein
MPRFYFDLLEDESPACDLDGVVLSELAEAEFEAAGAVAQLMAERQRQTEVRTVCVIIRDSGRTALSRVCVTLSTVRIS